MRERGIVRYQSLTWSARRRRRCLLFSDPTTVRSWCSTTTAICDVLRRGAATDLMGEVDDAPTARRIALMLGERPMWWSPEKGVRTKNASQPGQECETGRTKARSPTMAVPWTTRTPRAWTVWVITLWSKILSMRGDGEA